MANISGYIKSLVSSLATVATSGSYTDLINKPTLGTAAALDVGNNANQILRKTSDNKYPVGDGSNLTNVIASGLAPSVPYSVISAKTSSGVAAFITKTSNTQIDFDTNSGGIPIKICYPDGSIESNNSLTGISGISADNTYYVIKEKGGNPYNTTLLPIESYVAPATPATNQLWLDLSVAPYVPKKWDGSSWVITQFVKLGELVKTAGVIGTPINYALNGRSIITGNPTKGSDFNFNHNLGINYQFIRIDSVYLIASGMSGIGILDNTLIDFGSIDFNDATSFTGRKCAGYCSIVNNNVGNLFVNTNISIMPSGSNNAPLTYSGVVILCSRNF